MNMQNLMAQAHKIQKEMMKKKEEIGKKEFTGKSELVEVVFNGNKELVSLNIKKDKPFDVDDIEILEDMLKIAIKEALDKASKEVSEQMGATAGPLGDLF